MKGFRRQNQLFSLCGLNCGLCPMFLGRHCPGCGGGEGNQSCKIAACSIGRGVEYCFLCGEYPCPKYEHFDEFDSFITHRNRKVDMEKAREIGMEAYNAEQVEKAHILDILLAGYNDGRKKTLFCAGRPTCWSCSSFGGYSDKWKTEPVWKQCRSKKKAPLPQDCCRLRRQKTGLT